MNDPTNANGYGERETNAAYSVMIELGQVVGEYRGKFVVVGGAVRCRGYYCLMQILLTLEPSNGLRQECRTLLKIEIAHAGFMHNANKFSTVDDFGPQTVR